MSTAILPARAAVGPRPRPVGDAADRRACSPPSATPISARRPPINDAASRVGAADRDRRGAGPDRCHRRRQLHRRARGRLPAGDDRPRPGSASLAALVTAAFVSDDRARGSAPRAAGAAPRLRLPDPANRGDMDGMSTARAAPQAAAGQTVVLIGGSAGIGLETARRARAEGADVVLAARDPDRLEQRRRRSSAPAAPPRSTPPTRMRSSASSTSCRRRSIMCWSPPAARTTRRWRRSTSNRRAATWSDHLRLPIQVARHAVGKVRPGGTLLFMGGTGAAAGRGAGGRRCAHRRAPALIRNLALEVAPIRVNLIAAGFVDTPLSATAARRRAGRPPRRAARDAAGPPRDRAGGHRRAGRPPDG